MKTDSEYIEYLIQKSNHLACVCNALVAVLVEQKVCTKDDIDTVIAMYTAKQDQQNAKRPLPRIIGNHG